MSGDGHGDCLVSGAYQPTLPCPFCGCEKIDVATFGDSTIMAFCTNLKCKVTGPKFLDQTMDTRERKRIAIERWNTRAR